jgi:hypothetical protein
MNQYSQTDLDENTRRRLPWNDRRTAAVGLPVGQGRGDVGVDVAQIYHWRRGGLLHRLQGQQHSRDPRRPLCVPKSGLHKPQYSYDRGIICGF